MRCPNFKLEVQVAAHVGTLNLVDFTAQNRDTTRYATAVWANNEIVKLLDALGLPLDAPLSVLVVETLPRITSIYEHVTGLDRPGVAQAAGLMVANENSHVFTRLLCSSTVILRANFQDFRFAKGFEAGGVDFITKPFHANEVMMRVETHLKLRRLQQELRTETARFKTLADAAFEAILIHSGGTIMDVNRSAVRLFARSEASLIGANLETLLPSECLRRVVSEHSSTFEGEVVGGDTRRIAVEFRTKNLPFDDQRASVTAIRDLTRQKRMERERERLKQENSVLKMTMQGRYRFGDIIGRSPAMQRVYELIAKAAASRYPVVIYGESGTGKELAAKTIHALRFTDDRPFVTVNCGAVTESLFEREFFGHRKGAFTDAIRDEPGFLDAAHGGTLFLDEISELPLAMQVKLLRVLESGEYTPVGDVVAKKTDALVVAATNKNLAERVQKGKFREDLFYRIQVIEITLPALRERREDIRLLVEHILARHDAEDKMADLPEKLRQMLYHYDWPGNVRELTNTIQRYLVTDFVSLPGRPRQEDGERKPTAAGLHDAIESLERKMIEEALQQTQWHRGATARLLKIPRRTLQRKMQKYDMKKSTE